MISTIFLRALIMCVRSAFALEVDDVSTMFHECTNRSIVMVDEIGKGTSSRDGACLAAAILEEMDRRGFSGIFATHLHEVFALPMNIKRVKEMTMQTQLSPSGGHVTLTHKLMAGRCTDSMALYTARNYGLPMNVLARAANLSVHHFPRLYGHRNGMSVDSSRCPTAEVQSDEVRALLKENDVHQIIVRSLSSLLKLNDSSIIEFRGDIADPPPRLEGQSCVYVLEIDYASGQEVSLLSCPS